MMVESRVYKNIYRYLRTVCTVWYMYIFFIRPWSALGRRRMAHLVVFERYLNIPRVVRGRNFAVIRRLSCWWFFDILDMSSGKIRWCRQQGSHCSMSVHKNSSWLVLWVTLNKILKYHKTFGFRFLHVTVNKLAWVVHSALHTLEWI